MSRMLVPVCIVALLAGQTAMAVPRAFVASYGSDANVSSNCTQVHPCRGFAAALTVADPGGEILALDSIGYGVATITKSVTLTAAPGVYAGISVASGDGLTIATPGVRVILRNLTMNGVGGVNGVNMTAGASLAVENCSFSGFSGAGVLVNGNGVGIGVRIVGSFAYDNSTGFTLTDVSADIVGTKAMNNSTNGFYFSQSTVASKSAISDSVASSNGNAGILVFTGYVVATRLSANHNAVGVVVNGAADGHIVLVSSTISFNAKGAEQQSGGSGQYMFTLGNNAFFGNGVDSDGGNLLLYSPL